MSEISVVVLGDGSPRLAKYLPSEPIGNATDAEELRRILSSVEGDVLLVSADTDISGPYPIEDVCFTGPSRVLMGEGGTAEIRIAGKSVISAGTSQAPLQDFRNRAAGCLRVSADDREALAWALEDVPQGPPGQLWEQVLSLLVMHATAVRPVNASPFVVAQEPVEPDPDPVRTQARRCARGGDGWLSERTVRRMSRHITPIAVKLGLAPTLVTVLSLIVGAAAVGTALIGTRWGYLLTGVLMIVSLVLDCVDGEVARWTHRYSRSGAWLDAVGDRVKEYAVWFAVAWTVGSNEFWLLVIACFVLITAKHFLDYGWSLRYPPWRAQLIDVTPEPDPWAQAGLVPPPRRPPSWRRLFGMPIAERWILIAVLLPLAGPWVAFGALAFLGALSLAYTILTRIRWSHEPISEEMLAPLQALTDPGPLLLALRSRRVQFGAAAALGLVVLLAGALTGGWALWAGYLIALGLYALAYGNGPRGRLGWMTPSVARVTEMLALIALAWQMSAPWVPVFALLAASAWRHYDVIYRYRNQRMAPDTAGWLLMLGVEGRILVAFLLAVTVGVGAWLWFAVYLAVVAVANSLLSWRGVEEQIEQAKQARRDQITQIRGGRP